MICCDCENLKRKIHRYVVWLGAKEVEPYCRACWLGLYKTGWKERRTFQEFEKIYSTDDSRLFKTEAEAQLCLAKEVL